MTDVISCFKGEIVVTPFNSDVVAMTSVVGGEEENSVSDLTIALNKRSMRELRDCLNRLIGE